MLDAEGGGSIQRLPPSRTWKWGAFSIISPTTMTGTPSITTSASFQWLDAFARRFNSEPPIERVGRFELLNDVAGRQPRVLRSSPRPPRARKFLPASDDDAADDDKDFHHKASCSVNHSHPPFERVGRFELLNDVTGRKPRVFRKSPCPPLARVSSPASDNDASDGASDTECSSDAAGFELKESPCLHLEMRASLVDCNVG